MFCIRSTTGAWPPGTNNGVINVRLSAAGFAILAAGATVAARILSGRHRDRSAFLASSVGIVAVFSTVAFGIFPNSLPSNTNPEFAMTIYNAGASESALSFALLWFIPGMALATAYAVLTYRHFAGKID